MGNQRVPGFVFHPSAPINPPAGGTIVSNDRLGIIDRSRPTISGRLRRNRARIISRRFLCYDSRRVSGYFFQKCPIPGGFWVAFFKSAQFPAGLGLLFSKVPNPRRVSGCFFQKCPIPGGSWVAFFKSAQSPAGLGLLFSKVPNPRRVSGYFFQKCPIPGGACFTFFKSAQFPAGFALLFSKVPNSRRVLGCFHMERKIILSSRFCFHLRLI